MSNFPEAFRADLSGAFPSVGSQRREVAELLADTQEEECGRIWRAIADFCELAETDIAAPHSTSLMVADVEFTRAVRELVEGHVKALREQLRVLPQAVTARAA